MELIVWDIPSHFFGFKISTLLRSLILFFLVIPIIFLLSRVASKYFSKHYSPQTGMVVKKVIKYVGTFLVLFTVLYDLGFSIGPVLGAAGIVGIAIGFASQTTISNIISGIFLITERPFVVDDMIEVGNVIGQVMSIDVLSIKIRTPDNKLVRIPNETILKGTLTNITYFPVRRLDINIAVSYKESFDTVQKILLDIALKNCLCLKEPEPTVRFNGLGDSGMNLMLAVWVEKADFLTVRNKIHDEIKKTFDKEGIEIALPRLSIYTNTQKPTTPMTCPENTEKTQDS